MAATYRIGILSPLLDGFYFGGLLSGIHKAAREHGIQIIAIQTTENRMDGRSYEYTIGWDHMDAWIVILDAVSDDYVIRLMKQTGKPVVNIGLQRMHLGCPTVMCDNFDSTFKAVSHMLDHGYRNIAFTGWLEQTDIRERHEGYLAALRHRGITPDPRHTFPTSDNLGTGGNHAANLIIESGLPIEAIVAGTDMNAIGLIKALQRNGYRVPEDIAVLGFDDEPAAKFIDPPLSTIRQPVDEVGRQAALLAIRSLAGEAVDLQQPVYVRAKFVSRRSCGCSGKQDHLPSTSQHADSEPNTDPYALRNYMESLIANGSRISLNLLSSSSDNAKNMSWLKWTNQHWGCIALWSPPGTEQLVVDRSYSSKADPLPPLGKLYDCRSFPPADYLPATTHSDGEDITMVQIIRSETKEIGVFAFVGPVNARLLVNYETRQWFSILGASLERETLYAELKWSESRFRHQSEQLRASEERYRSFFNNTPVMILSTDRSGRIIDVNPFWLQRMEYTANEVLGKPISQFLPRESRANVMRAIYPSASKNPVIYDIELQLLTKSGKILDGLLNGTVIHHEDRSSDCAYFTIRDITERKQAEEKIYHLAFHDSLTDLPNRLLLHKKLTEALQETQEASGQLAVYILDLDRFKNINDTLGHHVGDQLLQFVSENLSRFIDEKGLVARLSGDEFIIFVRDIQDRRHSLEIAEGVLQTLKKPFHYGQQELFITASIGVSLFPADGADPATLIKSADVAMYRAKYQGKNKAEAYNPLMNNVSVELLQLENNLHKALENNEFVLYYQPQAGIKNGKLKGFEALLRWNSRDRGLIPPNHFIPLAEETGLIVPIGYWVLREACAQMSRWKQSGIDSVTMAVNISAKQLQQSGFSAQVANILKDTGMNPALLCLEITESTAIQNIDYTAAVLDELLLLGISISIDDFGTGHSSLSLLKRLPIGQIKIDRSFIRDMTDDEDDATIVNAIIAMARSLKLKVIAEGVETPEQLSLLKQMGCDDFQGYLLSQPQAAGKIETLLLHGMRT